MTRADRFTHTDPQDYDAYKQQMNAGQQNPEQLKRTIRGLEKLVRNHPEYAKDLQDARTKLAQLGG